jgi:hypothetical protein
MRVPPRQLPLLSTGRVVVLTALAVLAMGKFQNAPGCCPADPREEVAWTLVQNLDLAEAAFDQMTPERRWRIRVTARQDPAVYHGYPMRLAVTFRTRELYQSCEVCSNCDGCQGVRCFCPALVLKVRALDAEGTEFLGGVPGCEENFHVLTQSVSVCRTPIEHYGSAPPPEAKAMECDPAAGTCIMEMVVSAVALDPTGAGFLQQYDPDTRGLVDYVKPEGGERASASLAATLVGPTFEVCEGCAPRPERPASLTLELTAEELAPPF